MTNQQLVNFYWYAEQRRAECHEVTLLEIANEFNEKLTDCALDEAQAVRQNEDAEDVCLHPLNALMYYKDEIVCGKCNSKVDI